MQRLFLHLTNRFIYSLSLTLLLYLSGSVQSPPAANAQAAAFLVIPYYGEKVISQGYSSSHQAYDYTLSYEKVLATADGTVTKVAWFSNDCHQSNTNSSCGFGLYARINHANNYQTYYAHLSSVVFPFIDQLNGFPVKKLALLKKSSLTREVKDDP